MTSDAGAILTLPLREIGRLLRAGETTSCLLTEAALARLETTGRELNALVTLLPERARAEAARADAERGDGMDRGPLHGIPYGAKDLFAACGGPTSWGAAPYRDRTIDGDAAVIEALESAGAVLVGKLATVELAGGFGYTQPDAAWTGPGRNGRDPNRWAGGSSSGSGAAVAAGLVPFALGSETWGSITNPACFNGVVGVRPTYGLVSRRGAMALSWTMDKIGPLGRSVADCELVLDVIAGPDRADPTTLHGWQLRRDKQTSGFRFALLRGSMHKVAPEVATNARRALSLLDTLGSIEEIALPNLPYGAAAAVIIQAEAAAAFESFIEAGESHQLTAPEDRYGLLDGLTIPAVDYLRALRVRRLAGRAIEATLAPFDVIVAPTQAQVAPPIDEPFASFAQGSATVSLGGAGNLCGLPAVTAPNGTGMLGLPTGLEFMGRAWSDGTVLAAAAAFERVSSDERTTGSSELG